MPYALCAMPGANQYRFVSHWRVLASIEEVYDVVSRSADLPRWWPAAFTDSLEIQSGDETGVARVVRLESRGWLPYALHWHIAVDSADRPHGFSVKAWGDFEGRGVWSFEQEGAWANVTYDWQVRVNKPLVRFLSPLLRPLFASNHRWAMQKGEESLRIELARRRAGDDAARRAVPLPPGPVEFPTVPVAIGLAVLVGLFLLRRRR